MQHCCNRAVERALNPAKIVCSRRFARVKNLITADFALLTPLLWLFMVGHCFALENANNSSVFVQQNGWKRSERFPGWKGEDVQFRAECSRQSG